MATSLTITVLADVAKAVQGIDSIDQKTSSFGSNMKSAALAIGGAFSVDKIKGWVSGWVDAGLDASRAAKDIKVTFGDAAKGVAEWADGAAKNFGTTSAEAEKMAAKVGVALEGYGFSTQAAADASSALVQRSADIAKVMGTDTESVLARVETAMRGRTAGIKDYGVEIAKGASSTDIFNGFMDQTAKFAGQADTPIASMKATMGDLSAQLGMALIPVIAALVPWLQKIGDWATNNKGAFDAIVFVITALALVFGIATAAAGAFAIASFGALLPILLVVAGIAALVAIVVLVIKYWGDLIGWFHTAASAIQGVIEKLGPLILLFGPLGAAIAVVETLAKHWDDVTKAVSAALHMIESVVDAVGKAASAVGGFLSHLPHLPGLPFGLSAGAPAAGPAAYGAAAYAAPVFSPQITINGDIGDPTLAGRRIVAALESWTAANGRRRLAALVGS